MKVRTSSLLELKRSVAPAGWNVVSQFLNSAGNLLIAVLVARQTDATHFGSWSLVYIIYIVALTLTRASLSTLLLVTGDEPTPQIQSGALATLLWITCPVAILAGLSTLTPIAAPPILLLILIGLPALLVQDFARFLCVARKRPQSAAGLDLIWGSFPFAAAFALQWGYRFSVVELTEIWVLGAATACGVAILANVLPRPRYRMGRRFLNANFRSVWALAQESALANLGTYASPYLVALATSIAVAGTLRAAVTLMGGVTVVVGGLIPVLTVRFAQLVRDNAFRDGLIVKWSALLALISLIYGLVLMVVPNVVGEAVLGRNWHGVLPLIVPMSAQLMLRGPSIIIPVLLRVTNDFRGPLRLSTINLVPTMVLPPVGATYFGAVGAAWGVAAAALVSASTSVVYYNRASATRWHRTRRGSPGGS